MTARVALLGDTMLGGDAQPILRQEGYDYALAGIRHLWADVHLVVANHEASLTVTAQRAPKLDTGQRRYWWGADPVSAHTVARHGIRLVSLANNHVADFGADGVLDTMASLEAAGIAHCGAGSSDNDARRPAIVQLNGVRVGFLSVMQRYRTYVAEELYAGPGHPGPALLEMSRLSAHVADLREHVDVCVVLVHWGRNYRGVTALQRRLAGEMRAAGADLVIGHHPHIPQPVDVVDGVPVFHSLGNAAFSTVGRFDGRHPPYGLIAVVEMDRRGVTGLDLKLIKVDNTVVEYQPRPADSPTDLAYLETLRP